MNSRTLIVTAGAIVVLAAPAAADARILPIEFPTKQHATTKQAAVKHVAKPVPKRQGQSRQIYVYSPGPVTVPSLVEDTTAGSSDDC